MAPRPPPPGPENPPTSATGSADVALQVLLDMKKRILDVETLWIRVKQLDQKVDYIESTLAKLNGRVSVALRRRPHAGTDVVAPQSREEFVEELTVEGAEEIAKRHHSVQKSSAQQPTRLTTTSQTSPEQSPES